jgi:inner membrane protein
MLGRTHDMAAFTALTFVVVTHPLPEITVATGLVAIAANLIGGIAPDIDQPTAPFWRNLPIGSIFGRFFGKLLGGHRFLSHSVIGIIIFGVLFQIILNFLQPSIPKINLDIVWWAFMIGFISHLVMDSFTQEGVPWLLPLPVKFGIPPVRALRVPTGGFLERFIIFPGLILINVYLIYSNYEKVRVLLHSYLK